MLSNLFQQFHINGYQVHPWSWFAVPPLVGIWATGFFGLGDVRPPQVRQMTTWSGWIGFFLGLSYLMTTFLSFMMASGVVAGGNIYTWRGALLMWSIFGIYLFAGRFAPWRRIIRRVADLERLERVWRGTPAPSLKDLGALIAEGRRAIGAPMRDRADELARVMPRLVVALERIAVKQIEVARLRLELQQALAELRNALECDDPTGAHVQRINTLLDRLEGTLRYG